MVHDEAPATPVAPAAPPAPSLPVEVPSAAPAAPATEPTLHDFVLNLLRDPSAQQAFDLDPVGCLTKAGLTDITPADVQDVIPLVTDLVPTSGLPSVDSLPGLDDLTSSLSLEGAAGAEGGWAVLKGDSPLGATEGAGLVEAGLDGISGGVRGEQETPFGIFGAGAGAEAGLDGVHAGTTAYSPFGQIDNHLTAAARPDGLYLDGGVHIQGPVDKTVWATADQGLDDLTINQNLVPGLPGNVSDLAKGLSDPTAAASAIAGAVPALPAVPGLPQLPISDLPLPAVPSLPVEVPSVPNLPLPTGQVNQTVDAAQGATNGAVDAGQAGQAPDLAGHLPAGLPQLPNLPVNLPDLPVHLPQLPVEVPQLPQLPVAGGVGAQSGVGDVLDHTGLGNVINDNPVTNVVHDVVPDLHLGL